MDYSQLFDHNCTQYTTYLNTVIHRLEMRNITLKLLCQPCYIAIYDDLYTSKGYYVGIHKFIIIFDYGCSGSITPFVIYFTGTLH